MTSSDTKPVAAWAPSHGRGVAIALGIACAWSFTGLIFRSIEEAGSWETIFYRSIGVSLGVSLTILLRHRRATWQACRKVGRPGIAAALCLCGASLLFLHALQFTTVANITFLIAVSPFIAAALAWLLLRETVTLRTWVAAAMALCGVGVMVFDGLSLGDATGIFMALGTATLMAGYAVAVRLGRNVDMTPAVALSGLLAIFASALLVTDFAISWHDLGLCLLQGAVISAVCNSLFAYAARTVPATELMLLGLIETVLAPTWVWLVIGEVPSLASIIGGVIILFAVIGHAVSTIWLPSRLVRAGPKPM
jgi:DME family drug/metabolite transporter